MHRKNEKNSQENIKYPEMLRDKKGSEGGTDESKREDKCDSTSL